MLRRIGGVLSSLMVGVAAEASGSAAPTLGSVWTWGILSSMWYETSLWVLAAVCAYCLVVVGINTGWLPEPEERRRTRIHEAVLKVFSALCFIQEERFLKVMLPEVAKLPYGGAATQVGETGASRFMRARPTRRGGRFISRPTSTAAVDTRLGQTLYYGSDPRPGAGGHPRHRSRFGRHTGELP